MKLLFLLFTTESTCFSFSAKLDIRGGDLLDKARTELGLAEHGTGGEIHDSDVIDTDEAEETSESANIWSTNSTIKYSEVVPVILVGRL